MIENIVFNNDLAGINLEKSLFPISVAADILQVHQRTLRIYEEEKLLIPSRSIKNRRLYSFNDIERGKFIQHLTREIGINLAGIKIIFHLLEQQKINQKDYTKHIQEAAEKMNITPEIQQENRIKLSRRGRKPSRPKALNT